jgi:hypothetical protein
MPSSHRYQINEICELIATSDPKSVLDIGVGFGKYGFLSREYLELWDGRERYHEWRRQIDGIEAFKEYLTPIHKLIYNEVFVGNVLEVLPNLKNKYDLILLIDVLEHFTFEEGVKLLALCQKKGKNILISTPIETSHQSSAFDNPFETHKSQWKKKHFEQFKERLFVPNSQSLIILIGPSVKTARTKIKVRALFQLKTLLQSLLL